MPETFTSPNGRPVEAGRFRHKSGFNAADVPAPRGRPPKGTRVDGREIGGREHDDLLAKRDALLVAGAPRAQAALSLLREGHIDAEVRRDASAIAQLHVGKRAQNAYDSARRLGDPAATAGARRGRDSAGVTKPSDVETARALAEMLPARAPRRPALTDKRALAAQAIEWEDRRLRRHDERERERLAIGRLAIARQLHGMMRPCMFSLAHTVARWRRLAGRRAD